ncbi:C-type lectin mosGCTL-1 [Leptinotarsa decemlineata]|uniref:C-type lectin mosGCTL-1 n=1 Tax=Leptinotarsa decemlineata TaxID=7539 RepID=UPI000C255AB8|nr:perlucin-like [Leptinotarsa decemlineata]
MFLSSIVGALFFLLHYASSNPVKGYVALTDSLSNDVVINTLPSLQLQKFGERLYYFGAIFEGNYYQAMQFCNYHDMQLVSIESKEENDFLWKHMQSFLGWGEYWFWTSGTTMPDEHWVWMSTGKPILFANWFENQPDNAGNNEKCLEVRYSHTNKALMWNDHVCTATKHVICETTVPKSVSKMITNNSNCNLTVISVPPQ